MAMSNTYNIDYHAISEGNSTLEFAINDELFAICQSPEILHGDGKAVFTINKNGNTAKANVNIITTVVSPCDRCLDECSIDVNWTGQTIFKLTEHTDEYDGDIIYVNNSNQSLDLAQYIYESIILALPIERAHQNIEHCNTDVTKFISTNIE